MASNKVLNIEPIALGASAANILNPNITSLSGPVGFTMTQPYILITHIRVVNNDSSNHQATLYKGATGGSTATTAAIWSGTTIGANSYADWYGKLRLDAADFLTGFADSANKLVLNIDAEIGVS
jgi:hypothetical protein